MSRVFVDRSRCRGAGECVLRARSTFRLDPERKAVVQPNAADDLETLRDAERACPHFAIRVEVEEDGSVES